MLLPPNSIIASGPVIIENNRVLLNKHGNDGLWKFCGGEVEDFNVSLEENARREAREEMGIDIEIIRSLKPIMIVRPDQSVVVLIHFLAKRVGEIKPGPDILEWNWFPVDNLPADCAPNIARVLKDIF